MRKSIIILFCCIALSAHSMGAYAQTVRRLSILELQDYIAKCDHPLIVDFWATFCAPCNKEIPYLQRTADKCKDQELELLLVSLDLPDYYPGKIAAFAEMSNYHVSIAWLNETNAPYFCPKIDPRWTGGIPSSLFINNKTHYRRFFDRQLTEGQVEQEVKTLLAPSPKL